MLRQIGAATTDGKYEIHRSEIGCIAPNAPRGSWFHRHTAKNDKLESAIAERGMPAGAEACDSPCTANGCGRGAGMMPSMSIWTRLSLKLGRLIRALHARWKRNHDRTYRARSAFCLLALRSRAGPWS